MAKFPLTLLVCFLALFLGRVSSLRDSSFLHQAQRPQVEDAGLRLIPATLAAHEARKGDPRAIVPVDIPDLMRGMQQGRSIVENETSPDGLIKFTKLKAAMGSRLKGSLFFNLMAESGFIPAFLSALSSYRVTVLVPNDDIVRKALPKFNKLSKFEKQQVLGYHVLSGILPINFLQRVPSQTEFATVNDPHMLAMYSPAGSSKVSFSHPGSMRSMCSVESGDAYQDAADIVHRTVLIHMVDAFLSPPDLAQL